MCPPPVLEPRQRHNQKVFWSILLSDVLVGFCFLKYMREHPYVKSPTCIWKGVFHIWIIWTPDTILEQSYLNARKMGGGGMRWNGLTSKLPIRSSNKSDDPDGCQLLAAIFFFIHRSKSGQDWNQLKWSLQANRLVGAPHLCSTIYCWIVMGRSQFFSRMPL